MTESGHKKQATFLTAKLQMPIISQHGWNTDGHTTLTDEHGGITVHVASGEDDPVICRNGI